MSTDVGNQQSLLRNIELLNAVIDSQNYLERLIILHIGHERI